MCQTTRWLVTAAVVFAETSIGPRAAYCQSAPWEPLDKVLKPTNYFQIVPYGNDYKPGGIVVSCKGVKKYKGLPAGVQFPSPSHKPAVIAASSGKNATSFGGLASFLSNAMKLKFTAKKDGSLDVKQINAQNDYIEDETDILSNPKVVERVKHYTEAGCESFIVTSVLTTKVLEVTTSSTIGGSIQVNGTDLPECKDVTLSDTKDTSSKNTSTDTSDKKSTKSSATKTTTTKTSTEAKKTDSAKGVTLPKIGTTKAGATSVAEAAKGAAAAAAPAYGVYGCHGSATKITLSTDAPVAIALQMNPIVLGNASGNNSPNPDLSKLKDWPTPIDPGKAKGKPIINSVEPFEKPAAAEKAPTDKLH
jgi:hypothetical protein